MREIFVGCGLRICLFYSPKVGGERHEIRGI